MASPRQHKPRTRLGGAVLAGGFALAIALIAVSGVVFMGGSDDAGSGSAGPRSGNDDTSLDAPAGPPAKVELRPVLAVMAKATDCGAAPDVWCAEPGSGAAEGYRLGPAELRTADIVSAEARLSEYGEYVVGVTLSDAGAERFEQITTELAENTGARAQLAIVVDGRVVSAPQVQGPIPGGEIDISSQFTQAEAERLAAAVDP